MTWSFPPTHIVQDTSTAGSTTNTETPPLTDEFLVCGTGWHCLVGKEQAGVTMALIADALASIPDVYDWYTIALSVDFPSISQGSSHCGTFVVPCPGDEEVTSGGSVNCDLVTQSDGTSVSTGGASHKIPGPSDEWFIGNPDLAIVDRSLVVNPTPLFPVPDGSGNTSGRVLWTRDQLLALDGTLWLDWGFFGTGEFDTNIGVTVAVDPYNDTTPTPSQLMCLL